MALNASKVKSNSNKKKQPPIAIGSYPGRLVQLIDLGLQAQKPYKGKDKPPVQKVILTYELVDEFMKDDDGKDMEDKPRWVSETLSFYGLQADKATSTQRYNVLDPNNQFGGDFVQCVNTPVNVTIVHNPNVKDPESPYQNVGAISAMRPKDAMNCPELKNPVKVFDLDNPDMEVFNALPEWIQELIKGNLNFKGSPLEKALGGQGEKPKADKKEPNAKMDKQGNAKVEDPPFDADEGEDNPY